MGRGLLSPSAHRGGPHRATVPTSPSVGSSVVGVGDSAVAVGGDSEMGEDGDGLMAIGGDNEVAMDGDRLMDMGGDSLMAMGED